MTDWRLPKAGGGRKGGREGGLGGRKGGREGGKEGGVLPWLMATKKRAPTKF